MAINKQILLSLKEINNMLEDSPFSEGFFMKLLETTENKSDRRRVAVIRDVIANLVEEG